MYTKIFKQLGLIAVSGLLMTSCVKEEDLVQVNPNEQSEESFWQTDEDALKGVNSIYGSMMIDGTYMRSTQMLLDLKDDGTRSNSPWAAMANIGKFNSSIADEAIYGWTYRDFYQGIFRANQVFDNIEDIEFEDGALKNRILGQAHFLRGLYMFHMVNFFRNVPIPLSNETLVHEQKTQEEGWAQVISDLQAAADLLPTTYDNVSGLDQGDTGRATKGAALAYLGKAQLFNHDFSSARDTFKQVIDLGIYALVPNYADNFTTANENNSESIFEIQFSRDAGGVDLSWGSVPVASWSRTTARAITYAPRNFGWTDAQPTWALFNDFMSERTVDDQQDPRLNVTIAWNDPAGYQLYGHEFSEFYAANAADLNDLFINKYQNSDGSRADEYDWRSGINERLMRYADVLLMYAETLNETGATGEAYTYIQMVRDRVNLPNLQDVKPGMSQAEMRDQIAHERFLEFALEGHRFDDIRRWGWLEDATKLAWLQSRDSEFETYVPGREYFPLPQSEVDNNPGMNQNPGY
ncbi:RagB/SusD family nutrient uptake outer membrane protein [Allomuricauda sp. NBRC 101325]|uniref:RagB/SusD family nutrient uptake outer membrane protein n=1 Tax=Allomuricauda sp. NBRC 101325 TaxID=1113758 RepID=UPI0024A55FA2|nr:RagB/SusD family nutrient uptake outer membrane protein [Muricauda sp. NBRC 101325]GLU43914.1 membrane protein [Muricauda sp. NBRC 101325]